jgi:hypothetical protein
MLIWPTCGSWHLLPILANSIDDRLSFLLRGIVFDIAEFCFTGRTSSHWQRTRLEPERQLFPHQFDDIAFLDLAARLRPLTVDFDVPAGHGFRRQAPRFVKASAPQPSIDA